MLTYIIYMCVYAYICKNLYAYTYINLYTYLYIHMWTYHQFSQKDKNIYYILYTKKVLKNRTSRKQNDFLEIKNIMEIMFIIRFEKYSWAALLNNESKNKEIDKKRVIELRWLPMYGVLFTSKTQHNIPFLKSWLDVMTALMADRMWQKWHRKKRLTELIHDH